MTTDYQISIEPKLESEPTQTTYASIDTVNMSVTGFIIFTVIATCIGVYILMSAISTCKQY